MTEPTNTIKRNFDILPADNRVVFNKYDERHLARLLHATINNLPTTIDQIEETTAAIDKEMLKANIVMYVDSRIRIFDSIWDNLPEELKTQTETQTETEPENEPDRPTVNETYQ